MVKESKFLRKRARKAKSAPRRSRTPWPQPTCASWRPPSRAGRRDQKSREPER